MSLKLIKEPKNAPSFQNLKEEDSSVALELTSLASNIRKEVCGIVDSFFSFKKFDERKINNMLVLMLESRF